MKATPENKEIALLLETVLDRDGLRRVLEAYLTEHGDAYRSHISYRTQTDLDWQMHFAMIEELNAKLFATLSSPAHQYPCEVKLRPSECYALMQVLYFASDIESTCISWYMLLDRAANRLLKTH